MTPQDSNIPTPTPTPPTDPPKDETPSWAQQLMTQNADFANRLSAFEETLKPIVEPEVEPTLQGGSLCRLPLDNTRDRVCRQHERRQA